MCDIYMMIHFVEKYKNDTCEIFNIKIIENRREKQMSGC